MRQVFICGAILAALAAAPACAADAGEGNYLGASVGLSVAGETELDLVGLGSADLDLDTGVFASISGGHAFANGLSMETEALYLKNDIDSDDLDAALGFSTDPSVRSLGLLVNVQYALPLNAPFSPFVGAGAGVGKTKYKLAGESDSTTGFMWQLMAGVSVPVNEQFSLDVKYRYIRSPEIDYSATFGATTLTTEIETSAHVVTVGGRVRF